MSGKKTFGIIIAIVGVVCIAGSMYIKGQVADGLKQIEGAEKTVGMGDKLFSLTGPTQEIGKDIMNPFTGKIAEGKEQIAFYSSLANWLQFGGVALVITGAVFMYLGKKNG